MSTKNVLSFMYPYLQKNRYILEANNFDVNFNHLYQEFFMKKVYLLLVLSLFLSTSSFAQSDISFSHSAGGSYYGTTGFSAFGVTYAPRMNILKLKDEMTLSLGTRATAAFQAQFNSREGVSEDQPNFFIADLPFLAELNFGHASHKQTDGQFGGFVGAGYGVSMLRSTVGNLSAHGIVVNGGVRFLFKRSMGANVSYMFNLNQENMNVFVLSLFYTFGHFG